MRRSNTAWVMATIVATLVMVGCGSGVQERSAHSGNNFDPAVDEACRLNDALCGDDTSTGTGTDTSEPDSSAPDSSGTEAAVLAEIDALCATTVAGLEGLADGTAGSSAVPANDLEDLSAAMFDVNEEINELVTAWDAIETTDDETVIAMNDIAAVLFDFSTQIFNIAIAAGDGDVQATADALDALATPDSTAAEAGAQLFADRGAFNCQELAGGL